LPLTDIHETGAIADRMRMELAKQLSDGRTVTVSIGVASCGEKARTHQNLVGKADAALYQVKRSGKNRVELVTDGEVESDIVGVLEPIKQLLDAS